MNKTPQKAQSPGATGQSAEQTSSSSIIGHEAQTDKLKATLKAQFALRGHSVHELAEGGFLVCRHGLSKHCPDLPALAHFARLTGAVK